MPSTTAIYARGLTTETGSGLLRALPDAALQALWPRLQRVDLSIRTVLLRPGSVIEHLYFLESGTVSMIADLRDGARIEVGLVGAEGLVGLPRLFGAATSPLQALVQMDGTALRLPAAQFAAATAESPALLAVLLRYADAFLFQISQTAACNGRHHVEQRLARWLLMTHDRAGSNRFAMTQEFMSAMLGVGRPAVTVAIGDLERAGLVLNGRGSVQVTDRPALEAAACECYATVRNRFEEMRAGRLIPA